ncbi:MAG: ribonuclease P protein subunit [Nanoarchaeota archaeon]|nr:ribonuclease P protein subunit [Nanoarchaeota archaeon]
MKTNTYPEEIIGKTIEVVESKNSSDVGIRGKIIDETKKTILVKTKKGEKRLLKSNITFTINHQNIKGKNLLKRSEERIK